MFNRPFTSQTFASLVRSQSQAKTAKQQTAAYHHPSHCRCDSLDCNFNFGRQSDLLRHKESPTQQYPSNQHGHRRRVKEHNLNRLQNSGCENSGASTGSYHTQNIFEPTGRVDGNGLSHFGGTDSYDGSSSSPIKSSYDTSCSSFASSDNNADSDSSVVPYVNTSICLNSIGQWVEEPSSGSTSTAWQKSEALLELASSCNMVSIKPKPHVEEAMNCFQASFYGAGSITADEFDMVEHQ